MRTVAIFALHVAVLRKLRRFSLVSPLRGQHTVTYCATQSIARGVSKSNGSPLAGPNASVPDAELVICRQRPGTAKGFVFLSLEDETGIFNVVVTPQKFEQQALLISQTRLLLVRGTLQVEQTVMNLRARTFRASRAKAGEEWAPSHDFH